MSGANFAPTYSHLVRHITFTMEASREIYHTDLLCVAYWWRRQFWPSIIVKSTRLVDRFPNLETLTFPIKSDPAVRGVTWRPAFFAAHQMTKDHRIALAARWLASNCAVEDSRLRHILQLEIIPSTTLSKEDFEGSMFAMEEDAEWDSSELAEAFQEMKNQLMGQA